MHVISVVSHQPTAGKLIASGVQVLVEDVVLHTGRVRFLEHGITSKLALADAQHLETVIAYLAKASNHQKPAVREPVP